MPFDMTGNTFNLKPKSKTERGRQISELDNQAPEQSSWVPTEPQYCLDDLILDSPVRDALLDAISFYQYQDKVMNEWGLYKRFSDRINLSINLFGESGTGKTMASHAIAHALGKKAIFVDYAEIESKYVGETSKNIKQLFISAGKQDAIIIFDEADALLSRRVTDMRSSTDVSVNQTRSVLLNILNEYTGIVIFTTNFIQNFDPAFIRRIRYQIGFELPNKELRQRLWEMYIPDQLPTNASVINLAEKYEGISGSDIANAVFSAAIKAARLGVDVVDTTFFEDAVESIMKAKKENAGLRETVTKRVVTEQYVKEQLGIEES